MKLKCKGRVSLAGYNNDDYHRGRNKFFELAWIVTQALFVSSALPGSAHRRILLRLFGARIGNNVVVKPRVRIKFPWRLEVGDNSWIGEGVWIDNVADVAISSDVCVSQEAYICTGSHDWASSSFDLMLAPTRIEAGAWVAAKACLAPGVTVGEGAVLAFASVAVSDLNPWCVYSGNPAVKKRARKMGGRSDC